MTERGSVQRHVASQAVGGAAYETYTKYQPLPADAFGRPAANAPTVVTQDSVTFYAFTVNTDIMTVKFPVPHDYYGGDITVAAFWSNDGGADDNGKTVRWQLAIKVTSSGDAMDGTDLTVNIDDTYESSTGWIEHHSSYSTIPASLFANKFCIFIEIMAVTPVGTALSCDPHLFGLCMQYTARRVVL